MIFYIMNKILRLKIFNFQFKMLEINNKFNLNNKKKTSLLKINKMNQKKLLINLYKINKKIKINKNN